MENKNIFFFGAGLAAAIGFLYFTKSNNTSGTLASTAATPSTPAASTPNVDQPITTTAPPTTVNGGNTTVNNPGNSPISTPNNQVAPSIPAPVAAPVVAPIQAAPIVAPAPAPIVNPGNMPIAQVQPPADSAPIAATPVINPADSFYNTPSPAPTPAPVAVPVAVTPAPVSNVGQGGNVGSGQADPLGYGGTSGMQNTYSPLTQKLPNPDAAHLDAAGTNTALYNNSGVLKRPVMGQTVNSLYKEPAFMYDFTPIAN